MTSMWWAGEVVRKTLEVGLNDRVKTAHGKREAQQVLEQRRGKGSGGNLVNGHQRSTRAVAHGSAFLEIMLLQACSLRFTCLQLVFVDLQEERSMGCPSGLGQHPTA